MFTKELANLDYAIGQAKDGGHIHAEQKLKITRSVLEALSGVEDLECARGPECTCPYNIATGLAVLMALGTAVMGEMGKQIQGDPAVKLATLAYAQQTAEDLLATIRCEEGGDAPLIITQKEANA